MTIHLNDWQNILQSAQNMADRAPVTIEHLLLAILYHRQCFSTICQDFDIRYLQQNLNMALLSQHTLDCDMATLISAMNTTLAHAPLSRHAFIEQVLAHSYHSWQNILHLYPHSTH